MAEPLYVTAGAWGAGEGRPLTAAEIDTNFYRLVQRLATLEAAGGAPAEITNIALSGTTLTVSVGGIDYELTMPRVLRFEPPREITALTDVPLYGQWGLANCTNAGGCTVTIQDDATINHPLGTVLLFRQGAAGAVAIVGDTGVTIGAGTTSSAGEGTIVGALKIAADSWVPFGGSSGAGGALLDSGGAVNATAADYAVAPGEFDHTFWLGVSVGSDGVLRYVDFTADTALDKLIAFQNWSLGTNSFSVKSADGSTLDPILPNQIVLARLEGEDVYEVARWYTNSPHKAIGASSAATFSPTYSPTLGSELFMCSHAAGVAVTLPPNSTHPYPQGKVLEFIQYAAGAVTVSQGSGVTVKAQGGGSSVATTAQNQKIVCEKILTNTWLVTRVGV